VFVRKTIPMLQKNNNNLKIKIMKKNLFFFVMLASVAASAQRTTPVTIANTNVDYSTKVVTFDLSWKGSDATHRNEVWVFVDIRPITGANILGSWTAATLVPNSTTVTAGSGNQYLSLTYTPVSDNTRGIWVKGTSSATTNTFNATVKVTLNSATPARFNACAYVSDYPPNAVAYSSGTYNTLKGTSPFTITGNGTIQGNKYVGSIINSMTDATGCPGGVGRDEVHNGGTCAPGLTAVGNYCRNLSEDNAFALTCSGNTIEVKNSDAGTALLWANRDLCSSSGWRVATGPELKCICNQIGLTGEYFPNDTNYYDDYCYSNGYATVAILYAAGHYCAGHVKNGTVGACGVLQYTGPWPANSSKKIRCVR
jgi:hypothetical protein